MCSRVVTYVTTISMSTQVGITIEYRDIVTFQIVSTHSTESGFMRVFRSTATDGNSKYPSYMQNLHIKSFYNFHSVLIMIIIPTEIRQESLVTKIFYVKKKKVLVNKVLQMQINQNFLFQRFLFIIFEADYIEQLSVYIHCFIKLQSLVSKFFYLDHLRHLAVMSCIICITRTICNVM